MEDSKTCHPVATFGGSLYNTFYLIILHLIKICLSDKFHTFGCKKDIVQCTFCINVSFYNIL